MSAMLRSLRARVTSLERRLARTPTRPDIGQLADAGDIKATARTTAPAGWLICDGSSLLRSAYPTLFAAIGTTYGALDATHFTLPDPRGRVIVGRAVGQVEFDGLGETGGAKTHTLSTAEIPSHTHQQTYNTGAIAPSGGSAVAGMAGSGSGASANAQQVTLGAGGGGAHNNLQPYIVFNYLIKI
jgi:microcystin-dependent protein